MRPVGTARLLAADGASELDQIGEMSTRAHVLVLVATFVCLVFILGLVRRHGLRSKYSVLWLGLGAALTTLGIFPGLLTAFSRAVGINYPPAAFLAFAVGFLFLVVIHFSWELSRLEERTRVLAETAALLRQEVDAPPRPGSPDAPPAGSAPDDMARPETR